MARQAHRLGQADQQALAGLVKVIEFGGEELRKGPLARNPKQGDPAIKIPLMIERTCSAFKNKRVWRRVDEAIRALGNSELFTVIVALDRIHNDRDVIESVDLHQLRNERVIRKIADTARKVGVQRGMLRPQ